MSRMTSLILMIFDWWIINQRKNGSLRKPDDSFFVGLVKHLNLVSPHSDSTKIDLSFPLVILVPSVGQPMNTPFNVLKTLCLLQKTATSPIRLLPNEILYNIVGHLKFLIGESQDREGCWFGAITIVSPSQRFVPKGTYPGLVKIIYYTPSQDFTSNERYSDGISWEGRGRPYFRISRLQPIPRSRYHLTTPSISSDHPAGLSNHGWSEEPRREKLRSKPFQGR